MRQKLIVLTLLLALAAPLGANCLAAAPGQRMACCPSSQTEPMVRPCCGTDADRNGATIPAAAAAIAPLQTLGAFVPLQETGRFRGDARRAHTIHPIEIRLLTSVFLI
jgi:hypothetical protein